MSELSTEIWMAILFFFALCLWGITTFLFRHISIKHIENEMAKEGIEPPVWDKGVGGRIIMYAMVIVANKAAKHSPTDDVAILRHTRIKDKKYALLYVVSTAFIFILGGVIYYLYIP